MMKLSDFNFEFSSELIARYPLLARTASRLMVLGVTNDIVHSQFENIFQLLNAGDLLVFNNTKVFPARLQAKKKTGGKVEVLVERILDKTHMIVQLRASKSMRSGDYLIFADTFQFEIIKRQDIFYVLRADSNLNIECIIDEIGEIPLPPYLKRKAEHIDHERYQTIYAKYKGSVAAPTAGFHFDEALLKLIRAKQVQIDFLTLHVGAGTFAPVRVDNIKQHKMHNEYLQVSTLLCENIIKTKRAGNKVIAVGTTSLRGLETAAQNGQIQPYNGDTNIFIYPGYQFQCVDALITNFHLPCSTLLMLVCAFGGYHQVMDAYKQAVLHRYRFYSYGDAMWIEKCSKFDQLALNQV